MLTNLNRCVDVPDLIVASCLLAIHCIIVVSGIL